VALQHEGVASPDRFKRPDEDLAVGEVEDLGRRGLDAQAARDFLGQLRVRAPGEEQQPLFRRVSGAAGSAKLACITTGIAGTSWNGVWV